MCCFKFKEKNTQNSIPAKSSTLASIGQNSLEQPKILSEVEYGGLSFQFAYQYEIFWPFRLPGQNEIQNIDLQYHVQMFNNAHLN